MKEQEIHPVFRQLGGCGIASVVTIDSPAHAVPLAKALLAGGISAMELTLRSAGALECLSAEYPSAPAHEHSSPALERPSARVLNRSSA